METKNENFDQFLAGYCEALLWSEHISDPDDFTETIEDLRDYEFNHEARRDCLNDCQRFYDENQADLALVCLPGSEHYPDRYTYARAGFDFALTRNGHGAGFWDRGLGITGDQLSAAAELYGQADLYLDDDGKIGIDQNRGLYFRDLVLNRKYTRPSAAALRDLLWKNEDINNHAENVILCAMFAGSNVDLYIAYDLNRRQDKAGYLTPDLSAERVALLDNLRPALRAKGIDYV